MMWQYEHQHFTVYQLPVLQDNYTYLIAAKQHDSLLVVDPADAIAVIQAANKLNKPITHILNTHHHWDHTDGNKQLVDRFACQVWGAAHDADRIPCITQTIDIANGSTSIEIDGLQLRILDVPGHTLGHIAYVLGEADEQALFCGDVLFGAGCGRVFEGTMTQMQQSLATLATLSPQSRVYCAHEYTLANLAFAQHLHDELALANSALIERLHNDTQCRQQGMPTIPSTIAKECASNPFLLTADSEFAQIYAAHYQISPQAADVFSHMRQQRNQW